MGEIARYPLCWPNDVPRTRPAERTTARFADWTIADSVTLLLAEINRLNGRPHYYEDQNVIISTNVRPTLAGRPYSSQLEPADTGVAVYFRLRFVRNAKWFERLIVLTCDKWTRVAWNIYAIAKDIEAQRARHRWGCTSVEQAFRGYTAIPERTGGGAWWQILAVSPDADQEQIKAAYRQRAQSEHPDKGGTHERWTLIQEAYDQAMARFRQ